MDSHRFLRLQELFARLCDAPPDERRTAIARLRDEDPKLASQLERMLATDGGLADQRMGGLRAEVERVAVDAVLADLPETIAEFRILGVLGSGGMGIVYRAQQPAPVRVVALKVLQPGISSAASLKRFELEAQVLARLQHSGIAQIFAAGVATVAGAAKPYLAMELIEGMPLTRFAREQNLALDARIALLVQVAGAVHHAHQKGVVHRDLKPANILVTATGQPKILDFGIARVIDPIAAHTVATQAGQVLGTLPYMSPEQVIGATDAIDTRADVYALGVLAYELFSGRLPLDLDRCSLPEAARVITEQEPPLLGTIARALRGDIETIVAKALSKDPARRYASAHELALDLERYLREEPIEARPASTMYQVQKFARRHRGLVTGLSAAVVVMVLAVVGMSVVTVAARDKERTATAVASFLDQLLTGPDPWLTDVPGHIDLRLADVLARADGQLTASFPSSPEVEASVRATLGRTLSNLGCYQRALPHLARAHELYVDLLGADDGESLHCQNDMAFARLQLGESETAERLARDVVTRRRATMGGDSVAMIDAVAVLINVLRERGRLPEALDLARHAYDTALAALSATHPMRLRALHNLGSMLLACGDLEQAEQKLREVVDARRLSFGEEHQLTLASLGNLGEVLWRRGRGEEAEALARHQLEVYQRILGPEHPQTLRSSHGLAVLLTDRGKLHEALAMREQQLAIAPRVLGEDHPITLRIMLGRVNLLRQTGRSMDAEAACLTLLGTARRAHPEELPDLLNMLGCILVDTGRAAAAQPSFEEALDLASEKGLAKHWSTAMYHVNLGNCLRLMGDLDAAESELLQGFERLEGELGIAHDDVQYALGKLVLLYEKLGHRDKIAELRRLLTDVGRRHARGP